MREHVHVLQQLMPLVGARCQQLVVEDYFLLRSSFIANETLDTLFGPIEERGDLQWLEMHNVDLSRISVKSLVLVGRMKQLGQLSLVQCGVRVSD